MPSHFFIKMMKIKTKEYVKVLRDVVKPWRDGVAAGCDYEAKTFNMRSDTCIQLNQQQRKIIEK
jgi:hypothetical protein